MCGCPMSVQQNAEILANRRGLALEKTPYDIDNRSMHFKNKEEEMYGGSMRGKGKNTDWWNANKGKWPNILFTKKLPKDTSSTEFWNAVQESQQFDNGYKWVFEEPLDGSGKPKKKRQIKNVK